MNPHRLEDREGRKAIKQAEASYEANRAAQPEPKERDLRVWWIPQIPGKPFTYPVKNTAEAKLLLGALAQYDLFQLANRIKPDYCNVGGLEIFISGEWEDWEDEEGNDIDSAEKSLG